MSIIKVNSLFEKIADKQKQWKRTTLGQTYGLNGTGFDLYKDIERYSGKEKCNHRFNFLLEGNRCNECNSFSLLTHEGDILNEDIPITSGLNYGKVLTIRRYNIDNKFGYYSRFNIQTNLLKEKIFLFPFIEKQIDNISNNITMVNNDSALSHSIVISNLLRSYNISETDFLYMYMCDGLRVVSYKHENNVLVEPLKRQDSSSILYNFVKLFDEHIYSHNTFNLTDFCILKKQNPRKLSNTIRVNATELSSMNAAGYISKKNIILLGNKTNTDYRSLPSVSFDVAMDDTENVDIGLQVPMLDSYAKLITIVVRPSMELYEYVERTGIFVSDGYQIYMCIIMLLCNEFFHKAMTTFHMDIMKILFIPSEIDNVLMMTKQCHGKVMGDADIKKLAIDINFGMRLKIYSKLLKAVTALL